jgi:hypothetical protein
MMPLKKRNEHDFELFRVRSFDARHQDNSYLAAI